MWRWSLYDLFIYYYQTTSQLAAVSKRIAKRHQPDQLLAGIRAADINRPKIKHKPNTRNRNIRNKLRSPRPVFQDLAVWKDDQLVQQHSTTELGGYPVCYIFRQSTPKIWRSKFCRICSTWSLFKLHTLQSNCIFERFAGSNPAVDIFIVNVPEPGQRGMLQVTSFLHHFMHVHVEIRRKKVFSLNSDTISTWFDEKESLEENIITMMIWLAWYNKRKYRYSPNRNRSVSRRGAKGNKKTLCVLSSGWRYKLQITKKFKGHAEPHIVDPM